LLEIHTSKSRKFISVDSKLKLRYFASNFSNVYYRDIDQTTTAAGYAIYVSLY